MQETLIFGVFFYLESLVLLQGLFHSGGIQFLFLVELPQELSLCFGTQHPMNHLEVHAKILETLVEGVSFSERPFLRLLPLAFLIRDLRVIRRE